MFSFVNIVWLDVTFLRHVMFLLGNHVLVLYVVSAKCLTVAYFTLRVFLVDIWVIVIVLIFFFTVDISSLTTVESAMALLMHRLFNVKLDRVLHVKALNSLVSICTNFEPLTLFAMIFSFRE